MRLTILLLLVPHIRADGDAPNRTAVVFVAVPSQDIPADAALRQAVRQTWAPALERGGGALRFFQFGAVLVRCGADVRDCTTRRDAREERRQRAGHELVFWLRS